MVENVLIHTPDRLRQEKYRGCLLGGAVGDALGAPIEFYRRSEILNQFGTENISDLLPAFGKVGTITDDTQMTLFTAEGVLRAHVRGELKGIADVTSVIRNAYLRWLHTQGLYTPKAETAEFILSGWLIGHPELHARRAPGRTCISALMGSDLIARNTSKGCGGVMRVAPIGLFLYSVCNDHEGRNFNYQQAFNMGCEVAAITHGHPTGQLASGTLSVLIYDLLDGKSLNEALERAERLLSSQDQSAEVLAAIRNAKSLAKSSLASREAIPKLGEGWVAEEALAIGIYSALKAENFEDCVIMAVNHDGDSDSTGSIAGQLAGIIHGFSAIPERWLSPLELRNTITMVADDLATVGLWDLDEDQECDVYWNRYPGY